MKILVTGGAGFIGGNFVHYMVNKYPEYMIVNLDALTYAGNYNNIKMLEDKPNFKFMYIGILVFKFFIVYGFCYFLNTGDAIYERQS